MALENKEANLKKVWINYVQFWLDCAKEDPDALKTRKELLKGKQDVIRRLLEDKFEMKVPRNAYVFFTHSPTWPAVYIKVKGSARDKDEWIVIEKEADLKAILDFGNANNDPTAIIDSDQQYLFELAKMSRQSEVISAMEGYGINRVCLDDMAQIERVELFAREAAEIEFNIPENYKDCKVAIRLPFYDADNDLFGAIKFNDDEEIVLTCGC